VQALGPLLIGIALAAKILKQRALADPQALRSRRAFPLAKKSMGHLQAYIAKGDIQIFYAALAKAVTEYLAAKFSVPTAYIGVERLPEYYERFQVPEKIGAPFKVALMACEYVRYAAVVLPARDMRALHRDLRTAFHDFEKWWEEKHVKKTKKIPMAGIIILLLLAARAYAGDAELNFWRGNAFAEKGNYESAEAEYRKAIGDRVEDPDLSFNLGNAYAKQGKIGPAILAYERGLCFAPRDEDLRYNLSQVSSLVQNPQVREPRAPLKTWFIGVYRFFTADELAVGASVYYFLTIGWIVLMITWPERGPGRYRSVAGVLLACSLLLTAWSAARSHEHDWWKRAVVMVSKADVYARPYPRADVLFTLHEGTRVALKHEEEVWVEIELSSEQRGWIERSALGIIE
jgi:tetratricopeptide (TPR) repeat protein